MPFAHLVHVDGARLEHYEEAVGRLQDKSDLGGEAFHEVVHEAGGLRILDVRRSEEEFRAFLEEIAHVTARAGCPPPKVSSYDIQAAGRDAIAGAGLEYYEQDGLWDTSSGYENPVEQFRADRLARVVEGLGARRVLDAGAGNGIVANRLQAMGLDVIALDHSQAAMKRVETPWVVADIGALPFDEDSFDLVLSSEVLEHLPTEIFDSARKEFGRVARRWVVVTVPNSEDLYCTAVVCPQCRARSSAWRHMRSFTPPDLGDLIPGFRAVAIEAFGPLLEYRRRLEAIVTRELLDRWPWPPNAICPQCGYRHRAGVEPLRAGPGARSLKSRLARPLRRRVPKWLMATYEVDRTGNG
jgi:SAM-dependent methyltransferase